MAAALPPDVKVGAMPVTVELLVTKEVVREAASLPWLSWMALLSLELEGSV